MTTPFGMPTFVKVGKKKTPKILAPNTPKPPTESGNPPGPLTNIRTYTHDGTGTKTTHEWLIPSGTISGDGLLILVFSDDTMTHTPPAGYTLLEDQVSGQYRREAFWKIADGTEVDTTFTVSGGGGRVAFMAGRIPANGATLATPEVTEGGTNSTTTEWDPPAISPAGAPGTYHIISANLMVKGDPQPDAASAVSDGYTLVSFFAASADVLALKTYVQQKSDVPVVSTEDPGIIDWTASAGSRNFHSFTIAVRADGSDPTVSPFDHTHTEADVTDLDHWTEADHDALDHTGLTGVGGSGAVNDLTDATITTPADNEVLAYDSGTSEWINQTAAEAGLLPSSASIDDLSDVDTSTSAPAVGEVLKWDGSNWVPDTDATGSGSLPAATTKGDLAVYDGSAWQRIGAGTNDHVLTADSAQTLGIKWAAASGGAGGGWAHKITPAAAPGGTYDDEFDDATITGWTQVDVAGGAATWTEAGDVLSVLNPASDAAAELHAMVKAATINTGDYIETAVSILPDNSGGFPSLGVLIADGATYGSGQQVLSMFGASGRTVGMYDHSGFNTRDAIKFENTLEAWPLVGWIHLRLTYVSANTFRLEMSSDGVSWVQVSTDQTITLTPTHFGVFSFGWGHSIPFIGTFYYFRSNA